MTGGQQEEVIPWSPGGSAAMTRMGYAPSMVQGPAVWKHKPGKKTTTIGPDGRTKYKMTKEYFWLCDVGEGEKRLKQTKLSFGTPDASREGRMRDKQGYLGNRNATPTQGQ